MKSKALKLICFALLGLGLISVIAAILVYNGVILLNNPSKTKYPVRGVDVSVYQGDIDWSVLAKQNISFAFIKATEGSSFVDKNFEYNFLNAKQQNISVGAYHFFSFDSLGKTQAENFIKNVKPFNGMLPPVIDFEFYGDKQKNPPKAEDILPELNILIAELKNHYGLSPIIYATKESYEMYLANNYNDCDIWIRDVIFTPKLSDNRQWTFWQYTNREKLDGYSGQEKYIDLNVFGGSQEEFSNYQRYTGR